ncbi:glycosyltransferase 87 family protein [Nocardioides campestrisoli]|uniref:glycosyltransferase 87 family protein n=1 Tax=Nocardioides campestrisoli TaxID=2736757 RepID=UPI0017491B93|nr:glycosyltransferase 87 family protein [Nocardioides campestrisoli]
MPVLTPRSAWVLAVLSVGCCLALRLAHSDLEPTFVDLGVYRAEGMALRDGRDLYGPLPGAHGLTTYPPFAALLFVPTAFLPRGFLGPVSVLTNLVLLTVVAHLALRLAGAEGRRLRTGTAAVLAVAVWMEPVQSTLGFGQVNLLVVALVLADLTVLRGTRWAGVGTGLAVGVKVTPAIFVGYLLLAGPRRTGMTAAGTVALTVAISALVDRQATWDFWTRHLLDDRRVGRPENVSNQSVRGWLVRAFGDRDPDGWQLAVMVLVVLVVLVGGTVVAVRTGRAGDDLGGVVAIAATGLLVSPISWTHHWVWCVPLLVLGWQRSRLLLLAVLATTATYVVWAVPGDDGQELSWHALQVAASGPYVLLGVVALAVIARGSPPPHPVPRTVDNFFRQCHVRSMGEEVRNAGGHADSTVTVTPVLVADLQVEGDVMPVYVHVIDHPQGRVLVDTGMTELHPLVVEAFHPTLYPLDDQDLDVAGIDMVVNTHLHADHCGGNQLFAGRPVYVQRRELEDARSQDDYTIREWVDAPGVQYVPVDGELELLPGVRLVPAPGHTPGSQVVVVTSGAGRPVVICGDAAVWFGQLNEPTDEGQRLIRALDPDEVWLAHVREPWRPSRLGAGTPGR